MLMTNVLWAIIFFFIQPVFILGILYAWFNRNQRVNYSRSQFRVNFNRSNFELTDFLLTGIVPGIILSIVFFLLGIPVTIKWIVLYQLVAITFLLIGGSRLIHPIFTFLMASLLYFSLDYFEVSIPWSNLQNILNEEIFTLNLQSSSETSGMINTLLIALVLLIVALWTMQKNRGNRIFPILGKSKRGKTVALYPNKTLWVLPLVVLVPGHVVETMFNWWPVFEIGEQTYSILMLPVLMGFHYTVSTQRISEATSLLQKEFSWLAVAGLALFVGTYFFSMILPIVMILLLFFGIMILYRHRQRENQWSYRYGPVDEGLKVIAVRADSPAERLNLAVGDVIMTINEVEMVDQTAFDEVIAFNRSYIKMKVKRSDGEIVIAETPLYDNDFNNLGLLIL